jgi:hypothetical protein
LTVPDRRRSSSFLNAILQSCAPAILAAAVFVAAGCGVPGRGQLAGRATDEWIRSYPLDAAGEVQIGGSSGSVDVQGVDGDTVEVRAERIARATTDEAAREILPRISIKEETSAGKVALRTEALGGIVIGVSVEVRYDVRAPKTATIRVRTGNGAVGVKGFTGRVLVNSFNGGVTAVDLGGGVEVRSVNGNAKIALASVGADLIDLRVTNGGLTLTLPETANANLLATCTNGNIDVSALKLESMGEQSPRRVRGRLNTGGTPIELSAINGNILVELRPR